MSARVPFAFAAPRPPVYHPKLTNERLGGGKEAAPWEGHRPKVKNSIEKPVRKKNSVNTKSKYRHKQEVARMSGAEPHRLNTNGMQIGSIWNMNLAAVARLTKSKKRNPYEKRFSGLGDQTGRRIM